VPVGVGVVFYINQKQFGSTTVGSSVVVVLVVQQLTAITSS
jgi:hypothetical protein